MSVVDQLSPEEGQERMRSSRVVALAFSETTLPSGPTVLLDAMVEGKAIVVTDVGGTRDYADDDHEALLVPPGDAERSRAGALPALGGLVTAAPARSGRARTNGGDDVRALLGRGSPVSLS